MGNTLKHSVIPPIIQYANGITSITSKPARRSIDDKKNNKHESEQQTITYQHILSKSISNPIKINMNTKMIRSSTKSKVKGGKRRKGRKRRKKSNKHKNNNNNKYKNKTKESNKRNSNKLSSVNKYKQSKSGKSQKTNNQQTSRNTNNNKNQLCNPAMHINKKSTIKLSSAPSCIASTSPTFEPKINAQKQTLKQKEAIKHNISNTIYYRSMPQKQKILLLKKWHFVHGMNMDDDDNEQSRTVSVWMDDDKNEVIRNWYKDNPMMDNDDFYPDPIDGGNNIIIYVRKDWKPPKDTFLSKQEIYQEEEEIYESYFDEDLDGAYTSSCYYGLDLFEEEEEEILTKTNRDKDMMNDQEFISYLREKYYMCSISDPTPISTATDKPILTASHKITKPPKIIKPTKPSKPPNKPTLNTPIIYKNENITGMGLYYLYHNLLVGVKSFSIYISPKKQAPYDINGNMISCVFYYYVDILYHMVHRIRKDITSLNIDEMIEAKNILFIIYYIISYAM